MREKMTDQTRIWTRDPKSLVRYVRVLYQQSYLAAVLELAVLTVTFLPLNWSLPSWNTQVLPLAGTKCNGMREVMTDQTRIKLSPGPYSWISSKVLYHLSYLALVFKPVWPSHAYLRHHGTFRTHKIFFSRNMGKNFQVSMTSSHAHIIYLMGMT